MFNTKFFSGVLVLTLLVTAVALVMQLLEMQSYGVFEQLGK